VSDFIGYVNPVLESPKPDDLGKRFPLVNERQSGSKQISGQQDLGRRPVNLACTPRIGTRAERIPVTEKAEGAASAPVRYAAATKNDWG